MVGGGRSEVLGRAPYWEHVFFSKMFFFEKNNQKKKYFQKKMSIVGNAPKGPPDLTPTDRLKTKKN